MISIIVPIYNVEKYLPHTVESIKNQEGFSDWELILVDDGSKDGSPALCDRFAASDPRIKVVHKPNAGLSSARNAGIEAAKGQFIMFLDGDDCLDTSTLKVLNDTTDKHPACDLIQFQFEEVMPAAPYGHKLPPHIENYTELNREQDFFRQLYLLGGVAASACTKLIKRSTLGELRFKEGIIHEDELFTTHLLARCHLIGYCSNQFYKYVMRDGSIQHSSFTKKRLDAVRVREDRLEYLASKGYKQEHALFQAQLISNLHLLWSEAYDANDLDSCKWLEDRFQRYHYGYSHSFLTLKYHLKKILRPFVRKIRNAHVKWENKRVMTTRRRQLRHTDFSIISNNCWGELVYQHFGLKYTTPTVGLFIMDDDYIKFLERLDYYLQQPLRFIKKEQSRYKERLTSESTAKEDYPIALLDDVEIHFLHYHTIEEAREKWENRKLRINRDRLIVKMSQRFIHGEEILERFSKLPYKNKICFTECEKAGEEFFYVPELRYLNIQGGDETPFVMNKLDFIQMINDIK